MRRGAEAVASMADHGTIPRIGVQLRRAQTPEEPTRSNGLFKPAQALNLLTDLDGIRVSEADPADSTAILTSLAGDGSTAPDPCKIFAPTKGWHGCIAAAVMA